MWALEAFYICAVFKLDIISADWNIAAHDLAKRIQCLLEVWVVTTVLNLHLLLCSLTVGATVSWQLPLFIEWSGSMNLYFDQLQDIEIHTEVSLPNRTTLTVNAEGRNKKKILHYTHSTSVHLPTLTRVRTMTSELFWHTPSKSHFFLGLQCLIINFLCASPSCCPTVQVLRF